MTSIAWAICLVALLWLPEDGPVKTGYPGIIALFFTISSIMLFVSSLRELIR